MTLAGDHVQVIVNGYNLSGDSNRIMINDSRTMLDTTAFGDEVRKYIPGQRNIKVEHNGYFNREKGRSHPVLKASDLRGVVTVFLGQNAAPDTGDPIYSFLMQQGKYQPNPQMGQIVPFSASYSSMGSAGGWGTALTPPVNITNTTSGTAVDGGAATFAGGVAHLHVLTAAASDLYEILIEGASNAGFTADVTTLATFTCNGSVLGSERVTVDENIPRYIRYRATRTGDAGDTLQLAVSLVRF